MKKEPEISTFHVKQKQPVEESVGQISYPSKTGQTANKQEVVTLSISSLFAALRSTATEAARDGKVQSAASR